MTKPLWNWLVAALVGMIAFSEGRIALAEEQLVQQGNFASAAQQSLPAPWSIWSPEATPAACRIRCTPQGLLMDSPQEPFAVGGVRQDLKGVQGGKAYAVEAVGGAKDVKYPYRSLMIRLTWTRGGNPLHPAGIYVRGPQREGAQSQQTGPAPFSGRLKFHDVLVAPQGGRRGTSCRWKRNGSGGGSVCWERVSVRPTCPAPAAQGQDRHGLPAAQPKHARAEPRICSASRSTRPAG